MMIEQAVAQALADNLTPAAAPVVDIKCANCFELTPNDDSCCASCKLPPLYVKPFTALSSILYNYYRRLMMTFKVGDC